MTIMTKKYDKLDETFDVEPTEIVKEKACIEVYVCYYYKNMFLTFVPLWPEFLITIKPRVSVRGVVLLGGHFQNYDGSLIFMN